MESSAEHPHLRQTVLDTPDPRLLAEFYRELLGFDYRDGDEPRDDEAPPDWLVLVDESQSPQLAFQLSPDMPRPQWPTGSPAQMLHLDLTVESAEALESQRVRALGLGAAILLDRSDDDEEPLFVFSDPAGHPFCIFVAQP